MTTPPPDVPRPRRFQFSLRSIFWFTTVVAVACASFACSRQLWGDSGVAIWWIVVFLFWPSLVAIVWTRPDVSFPGRVRLYVGIGGGLALLASCLLWPFALAVALITAFVLWAPQGLMVFAAVTDARERVHLSQAQEPITNTRQQEGDRPSDGAVVERSVE